MTNTTPEPTGFADDIIATATAVELAQRLDLVRQLAEHPGINRGSIEAHLTIARELHEQLGAYLATVALP